MRFEISRKIVPRYVISRAQRGKDNYSIDFFIKINVASGLTKRNGTLVQSPPLDISAQTAKIVMITVESQNEAAPGSVIRERKNQASAAPTDAAAQSAERKA
jgi:hypothetical protein